MKMLANIVYVGLAITLVHAYPAKNEGIKNPDDDAELVFVPLEKQTPSVYGDAFDGVIDTGTVPDVDDEPVFFPSINPFSWQISSFLDEFMTRLRDRFANSWHGIPLPDSFGHPDEGFPSSFPTRFDIPDGEDGKVNSTSVVKIIDGHKVVINDTFYTKKDDFGTSIFKVRTVNVVPDDEAIEENKPEEKPEEKIEEKKPEEEAKTEEVTSAKPRDTELDTSEEDIKNEIDDSQNAITDIDTPVAKNEEPEIENLSREFEQFAHNPTNFENLQAKSIENSELFEDDSDDGLSYPDHINGGSELEDLANYDQRKRIIFDPKTFWNMDHQSASVENEFDELNESDQQVPIDLSNDIKVNEILASQNRPMNPDAEVFSPDRVPQNQFPVFQDRPEFPSQFPIQSPQFNNRFPILPNFPSQNFPSQNFPSQNFPAQSFPPQNFPSQNFPAQSFPPQNFPAQNFATQNFPKFPQFNFQGSQRFPTNFNNNNNQQRFPSISPFSQNFRFPWEKDEEK